MMGQRGGSTVLTEVPEMFGAEGFLMDRCINHDVFVKAEHMINGFKDYFISHNEVVYDNPSPGNKQGGITTLEDKSCGCVQKGGTAPIMDVIGYGDPVVTKGLNMLYGPGNDLVSATAMTAAGAHLILCIAHARHITAVAPETLRTMIIARAQHELSVGEAYLLR